MSAGKTEATTHLVIRSNRKDMRAEVVSFGSRKENNLGILATFSATHPDLINMPKICLPLLDLHRRVLAEIRRMPGCHNVQEIAINHVTEGADFNWSTCVLSSGTADANTAARAAIHVQSVLRRDYDLLTD